MYIDDLSNICWFFSTEFLNVQVPWTLSLQDEKINSLLCTSNIYNKFGFDNFLSIKTIYPSLFSPFFLITFLFEFVLIL